MILLIRKQYLIVIIELLNVVDEYMSGEKEYYYPVIKEQLDIRSEYLGFKYAIIHSNDLLKHDFGDMTIWNKKGE